MSNLLRTLIRNRNNNVNIVSVKLQDKIVKKEKESINIDNSWFEE